MEVSESNPAILREFVDIRRTNLSPEAAHVRKPQVIGHDDQKIRSFLP